eukprot:12778099-Alexandrium_andersonii.AAC.1
MQKVGPQSAEASVQHDDEFRGAGGATSPDATAVQRAQVGALLLSAATAADGAPWGVWRVGPRGRR